MGNLIDPRKIFGKLAAEIFPLGLKKFTPQNLNLMGITGSVYLNKNQCFVKPLKVFCRKKQTGWHFIVAKLLASRN